ncbi:hypothetical protein PsYK624_054520 [Phanerochaete sordida]|uniref:Uncharacterized protein n=1 Tax=Phanerochaete sordida TaxID=48140 RepID=A0A9P3LCL4_9APHY|nr:hypothetical protein PsYK624_054520 [Phanerochaete sordida]
MPNAPRSLVEARPRPGTLKYYQEHCNECTTAVYEPSGVRARRGRPSMGMALDASPGRRVRAATPYGRCAGETGPAGDPCTGTVPNSARTSVRIVCTVCSGARATRVDQSIKRSFPAGLHRSCNQHRRVPLPLKTDIVRPSPTTARALRRATNAG